MGYPRLLYLNLRLLSEALFKQDLLTALLRGPQLALEIVRPCSLAFFVLLMFGNTLPTTQARRWGPVMLALQTLLALLMGFGLSVYRLAEYASAGFTLWVGMFLLWPLLHRAAPRDYCGGCSCCCRSCGGCPLFPNACPGECCCSCRTANSADSANKV